MRFPRYFPRVSLSLVFVLSCVLLFASSVSAAPKSGPGPYVTKCAYRHWVTVAQMGGWWNYGSGITATVSAESEYDNYGQGWCGDSRAKLTVARSNACQNVSMNVWASFHNTSTGYDYYPYGGQYNIVWSGACNGEYALFGGLVYPYNGCGGSWQIQGVGNVNGGVNLGAGPACP